MQYITKILFGIILAVSMLSSAYAESTNNFCKQKSNLAMQIMHSRQIGVPITKLLEVFAKDFNNDDVKDIAKLGSVLVEWAYTKPRYDSKEFQNNAVSDFGTEVYFQCMKASGKEI